MQLLARNERIKTENGKESLNSIRKYKIMNIYLNNHSFRHILIFIEVEKCVFAFDCRK